MNARKTLVNFLLSIYFCFMLVLAAFLIYIAAGSQ